MLPMTSATAVQKPTVRVTRVAGAVSSASARTRAVVEVRVTLLLRPDSKRRQHTTIGREAGSTKYLQEEGRKGDVLSGRLPSSRAPVVRRG